MENNNTISTPLDNIIFCINQIHQKMYLKLFYQEEKNEIETPEEIISF